MIKRIFDIFVSLFVLIIFSPIYIVIAYKVKKNLGSPVLFRQIRPGLYGKPFEMIKFRTMKDAIDKDGNLLPDADRLTSFGKMLRSTSLDELPEFWNVLKGEMSLVGPRPLLMEYLPLYNEKQAKRHNLKPGITGYAQVNGRNAISWVQKFELDSWYVENQSFWLDIKIILKTIKKVFLKDDITSEGEATTIKFAGNQPTTIYAVYGASGCGRSLMPVAREYLKQQNTPSEIYFIDDSVIEEENINGHKAISYEKFKSLKVENKKILIAIANSKIREAISDKIKKDHIELWSVFSSHSIIMDNVEIDQGCAISPFVTVGSNVKIGINFHANLYSYIEHDCVIGNYVTFAPGVKCNGNVHIDDHAYIGAGAIIKQGTPNKPLKIGKGAVIGMGAIVTKDIPAGETVVGNPAKKLIKQKQ